MKKFVLITAILLSTGLSSKAQYSLMTRGERCPFDSAVAIRLDVYRLEGRKMKLADTLITNLSYRAGIAEEMTVSLNRQLAYATGLLQVKEDVIFTKEATIRELLKQMSYVPERSWWEKNNKPVLFIGGVAVGIGGAVLVACLMQ
jgi:hypothetical protein